MKKRMQYLVGFIKCLLDHISFNQGCYIGINVKISNSGGYLVKMLL